MELSAEFDVQFLFDRRREVRETVSDPDEGTPEAPLFTTLSLLSSRDAVWGAYLFASAAYVGQRESPWQAVEEFSSGELRFAQDYRDQPWASHLIGSLPEGASYIRYAVTEQAFLDAAMSAEAVAECLRRNGGHREVRQCLRRFMGLDG